MADITFMAQWCLILLVAVGGGIMTWHFLDILIEKKWIKIIIITILSIGIIWYYATHAI
jgi:hypothetical protein